MSKSQLTKIFIKSNQYLTLILSALKHLGVKTSGSIFPYPGHLVPLLA